MDFPAIWSGVGDDATGEDVVIKVVGTTEKKMMAVLLLQLTVMLVTVLMLTVLMVFACMYLYASVVYGKVGSVC